MGAGSWDSTPQSSKTRITANGRSFDVEPGQPFDKAVHQIAKDAGMTGRFYVKFARAAGQPLVFVDASNAPQYTEAGMQVTVTPHSQGAQVKEYVIEG